MSSWINFVSVYRKLFQLDKYLWSTLTSSSKCDLSAQNQSLVAKHKVAENCILSKNVKKCVIFCFHKNKIFWARLFQNIKKTPWQRCIGYTSISITFDIDVKSMFFIMCLRSLVVRALERYFKDPGLSPG